MTQNLTGRDVGPMTMTFLFKKLIGYLWSGIDSVEALVSHLLMGPEEISRFLDEEPGVPLNTDDHPYLEYSVPGDLFYGTLDNTRELAPHVGDPTRYVDGLPAGAAERIRALSRELAATLSDARRAPDSPAPAGTPAAPSAGRG